MAASTLAASSVLSSSAFLGSKATLNRASVKPVAGSPSLPARRFVCSAEKREEDHVKPNSVATAITTAMAMFAAFGQSQAGALVDERLSTEGTGLPLGINDSSLIWVFIIIPTIIWALYYNYSSIVAKDVGEEDGAQID